MSVDVKELLRLSEQATRLPWEASRRNWRNEPDQNSFYVIGNIGESEDDDGDVGRSATAVCIVGGTETSGDIPKDTAAYIVAAANSAPELCRRVEAAEARVRSLEDCFREVRCIVLRSNRDAEFALDDIAYIVGEAIPDGSPTPKG